MTICSLIHQAIEVTRLLAAFILKYSLDGSNLKKKNWLKKVYIYIYIKKWRYRCTIKKKKSKDTWFENLYNYRHWIFPR